VISKLNKSFTLFWTSLETVGVGIIFFFDKTNVPAYHPMHIGQPPRGSMVSNLLFHVADLPMSIVFIVLGLLGVWLSICKAQNYRYQIWMLTTYQFIWTLLTLALFWHALENPMGGWLVTVLALAVVARNFTAARLLGTKQGLEERKEHRQKVQAIEQKELETFATRMPLTSKKDKKSKGGGHLNV